MKIILALLRKLSLVDKDEEKEQNEKPEKEVKEEPKKEEE